MSTLDPGVSPSSPSGFHIMMPPSCVRYLVDDEGVSFEASIRFLAWGAVSTWITVFTEGAGTAIDMSGPGNDRGEGPAVIGAIVFTVFALLAGAAAAVAGYSLAKDRSGSGR